VRDRLRRLNDPGKFQLQVERDSEGNAVSLRAGSRRAFSSSLSPPRERNSTSGWVTQLTQHDRGVHFAGLHADSTASQASPDDIQRRPPTASEELAQWKPAREGEGAGNRWRFKDFIISSQKSLDGMDPADGDDSDDETMSVDSFVSSATNTTVNSVGGLYGRLPVSQRATNRWVEQTTAYLHTGAVPAEFVCTGLGFLVMIAFMYWLQYALRHGYIQPSMIPNIARQ